MDRSPQPLVWINGWPAVGKQTVAQCLAAILGQDRAVLIDGNEFTDQLDMPADQQHISPGETPGRSRESSTATTSTTATTVSSSASTTSSLTYREGKLGQIMEAETTTGGGGGGMSGKGAILSGAITEESPTVERDGGGSSDHLDFAGRQAACFHKYLDDPTTMGRIVIFTNCQPDDAEGAAGAATYEAAARRSGRPFVPIYMECRLDENVRRTQTSERRYSLSASKIRSPMAVRTLRAQTDGRLFVFPESQCPGLSVDVTDQDAHETAMQILAFLMDRETGQGGSTTSP